MRKIAIASIVPKLDFWPSSRWHCVVQQYTVDSLGPSAWGRRRWTPDSDTRWVCWVFLGGFCFI